MLDTSWKRILLVFSFAMVNVCFALVDVTSLNSTQDVCSLNQTANVTTLRQLAACCKDPGISWNCSLQHNGRCVDNLSTESCDYTVDECVYPLACTCCGSCTEQNTSSQCKVAGGRCSKTCLPSEYADVQTPCHYRSCKCCKKKCKFLTCADGRGYCSSTGMCKRGCYPSGLCNGTDCTCCVSCSHGKPCSSTKRFCEWNQRACPNGYFPTDLCCPDPNCRCCDIYECGKSTVYAQKIVGGQNASAHAYPWQVYLNITGDDGTGNITGFCGASIIKRSWLLSAAHCFVKEGTNISLGNLQVVASLGAHNIKANDASIRITITGENIIINNRYVPKSFDNDIALLKLDQPIKFDDTMQPICMPSPKDYAPPEKEVVATGWGDTAYNGTSSDILQVVTLKLKSPDDCKTLNDKLHLNYTLTDNMICAYADKKDTCQGDSGGPLITWSTDNRWVQLGIVSFGYKCAKPMVPGVYTKVVNYLDWIKDVTKPDDC